MQITADLLGCSSAVGRRQAANFLRDEPVVKREEFQANHARHVEPDGVELLYLGVSGPRWVSSGRDHGKDGLSVFVECCRADR